MKTLLCLTILCFSADLFAFGMVIRFGPASTGSGGPNPLGIPPSARDIEISAITANRLEFNLGLPGAFCGLRTLSKGGLYLSTGGGVVIDSNGVGPGVYTAFGWDFGWRVLKFNFEYKQALGISTDALMSPYAVRAGVGLWFH